MMLFLHTCDWVTGVSPHTGNPKTQTRRVSHTDRDGNVCEPPYKVGRTYAVQPKFMGKAVARIRILDRRLEKPEDISHADVKAEGFSSREQFLGVYGWINEGRASRPCWVYVFELAKE